MDLKESIRTSETSVLLKGRIGNTIYKDEAESTI